VEELGEEEAVGDGEGVGGGLSKELGEDDIAKILRREADVLGGLVILLVDDEVVLALNEGVRVEVEDKVVNIDGRRLLLNLLLLGAFQSSVLKLGLDRLLLLLLPLFLLDLCPKGSDLLVEPPLQLRLAVCLEEFGTEKDETVRVSGGTLDVLLAELDVDALEADCGRVELAPEAKERK
jgi:hypothetical protein